MSAFGVLGNFNISGQICRFRDCISKSLYCFSLLYKHYIIIFIVVIIVIIIIDYLRHSLKTIEFNDFVVL